MRQVGEQLPVLVEDLRADRNAQLGMLTGSTVLQRAAAVAATLRLDPLVRPEAGEVAQIRVGDQHDVPAGAAVAAVRPALGNVLLATERQAAVAAPPRLHVDAGAIVEHGPVIP